MKHACLGIVIGGVLDAVVSYIWGPLYIGATPEDVWETGFWFSIHGREAYAVYGFFEGAWLGLIGGFVFGVCRDVRRFQRKTGT